MRFVYPLQPANLTAQVCAFFMEALAQKEEVSATPPLTVLRPLEALPTVIASGNYVVADRTTHRLFSREKYRVVAIARCPFDKGEAVIDLAVDWSSISKPIATEAQFAAWFPVYWNIHRPQSRMRGVERNTQWLKDVPKKLGYVPLMNMPDYYLFQAL